MLEASCVHMALGAWINILQRQTLSMEYSIDEEYKNWP